MGGGLSRVFNILGSSKKEQRIVMVGLDNAGKTTILYQVKMGEVVQTTPTIGFNVETVKRKNLSFSVWDVGGQDQIRGLWRHYFLNTAAVIFVVDSNDVNRLAEAKAELWKVLESPELENCLVLVFANKQDLPQAVSEQEVTNRLELNQINGHEYHVCGCTAIEGKGLDEGFDWLADKLKERK
mmetsp:Transcript_7874/g.16164  ORF Transcript_7874/g.16164 Transcript_7874/m.16164 type:complete len:183 (-) Transcript_7874:181-729(-)